ncbi:response regulator transcription factor [Rhizobium hidalgonense]|uniref:response regulator transcription factor n=1 Tax=Rhizobium hidalgonense TaxID=1538159 RepID=UPI002872A48D|nr:response regulator [Rhizobium hidalgonense]MDR9805527.1 response regulator [Rhizobium hidalgonense]
MKHKVLIVEDELLLRMMAVDLVEDAGFEAFEAGNALEALVILETTPGIRILFTDIDMPGSMDGLMLAAAARDKWPPIQIIVVSGKQKPSAGDMPDRSVFFVKPYDIKKVTDQLHQMAA